MRHGGIDRREVATGGRGVENRRPERMTAKRYHRVLTIAGSDSGGGAGIQADIKTFSALGCYGMSAITAVTAQNTRGVRAIHPLPTPMIRAQIDAIFDDMGADATKIGMLYSAELIETVALALKRHGAKNIVLDPVMDAESGTKLLHDQAIHVIKKLLLPLAAIVTPNLPEASKLSGRRIRDSKDMREAARTIASFGSRSVLIKGGHGDDKGCNDLLFLAPEDRFVLFEGERIATKNNHGTGCTLSSAIASFLAMGYSVEGAVESAKAYVTGAIKAGAEYEIGGGKGPVHHLFRSWR